MFGHELPQQFILPIGGLVSIDADAGTITMLESAVALPRAPRV
jgi:muramoyltetrapeptide carboxypeptidase LdcA involved in peptidoglycan recycling